MVGGVVIGLSKKDGKTHVHVADCPHSPRHGIKATTVEGCPHPDTCCVYTDSKKVDTGEFADIKIGDSFWWQGGYCYWTSAKIPLTVASTDWKGVEKAELLLDLSDENSRKNKK